MLPTDTENAAEAPEVDLSQVDSLSSKPPTFGPGQLQRFLIPFVIQDPRLGGKYFARMRSSLIQDPSSPAAQTELAAKKQKVVELLNHLGFSQDTVNEVTSGPLFDSQNPNYNPKLLSGLQDLSSVRFVNEPYDVVGCARAVKALVQISRQLESGSGTSQE